MREDAKIKDGKSTKEIAKSNNLYKITEEKSQESGHATRLNEELKACKAEHLKTIKSLLDKIKIVEDDREKMRETVTSTQAYLRDSFVPDQNVNTIQKKEIETLKQMLDVKDKQIQQLKESATFEKVREDIESAIKKTNQFLKNSEETNEKIMSLIILTNNSIKYIDTVHSGREAFHLTQISSLTSELEYLRKELQERDEQLTKYSNNMKAKIQNFEVDYKKYYDSMSSKYNDLLSKYNCLQNIVNSNMVEKFQAWNLRNQELVKSNKIMELHTTELTNKCNSLTKLKDDAKLMVATEIEQLKLEKQNHDKNQEEIIKLLQEENLKINDRLVVSERKAMNAECLKNQDIALCMSVFNSLQKEKNQIAEKMQLLNTLISANNTK
jgi:hypothetical protein